jgi:type I restriction enzyme S subunit
VPEHWEVDNVKNLSRAGYKTFVDGDWIESPFIASEGIRLIQTGNIGVGAYREKGFRYISQKTFDALGCTEFMPNDVLICRLGEPVGRACLAPQLGVRMITSVDVCILKPRQDVTGAFVVYAMSSSQYLDWVGSLVRGSTRDRVSRSMLGGFVIPVPPFREQSAIVRFLDHADRRIRRYIRAKQKLIKLLEEQKQAIIHRAVTRGLDPNVRLKPSGVEWLGDVPQHWEVRRLKQLSRILRGKFTHRPRNDPSLYDGPYPFIQTGDVARVRKVIASFTQTLNDRGLAVSKMFPRGTLVMTIAANIGDVAVLDFEACFPDSVVGFVPQQNVERDFLFYVFRAMKPELLREAPVNTQGNLNVERIGSRAIALPSLAEQREIARTVEERTADLEQGISVARNEISLLREYRTRVIADVVTGKVDVRAAAASLPDEADDVGARDAVPEEDDIDTPAEGDGEGEATDFVGESEETEA